MAAGSAAIITERSQNDESMTIKLGNLLPGQSATLKMHIIHKLEIVGGHYAFCLPVAFYPDYRKHGLVSENNDFVYSFGYEVTIISANGRISNLSIPENSEVTNMNDTNSQITVQSQQISRSIDLYYKTSDMFAP